MSGPRSFYRVHPSIGVARLGDADPSTYFLAHDPPARRIVGGRTRPQAARFTVHECVEVDGRVEPVREVTIDTPGVLAITWTVHLANKKASFKGRNAAVSDRGSLENDYGPRTISGRSRPGVELRPGMHPVSCVRDAGGAPVIPYLGELRTDAQGRLLVLGGRGRAGSDLARPPDLGPRSDHDHWFDDTSDGPVVAVVTVARDGVPYDVAIDVRGRAWVVCAPPDLGPDHRIDTSLVERLRPALATELGPGQLTRSMAVPWQVVFNECRAGGDFGWWPTQPPPAPPPTPRHGTRATPRRPASTQDTLAAHWGELGFAVRSAPRLEVK
jgi:hypothetical protein